MINIEYLMSGNSFTSNSNIKNNEELEKNIMNNLEKKSIKRKIKYLKLSNAMRELFEII